MTAGSFLKNQQNFNSKNPAAPKGDAKITPLAALQWHNLGDFLTGAARHFEVEPEAALAVWMVEAGDLPFVEGKPILRLECHKLWENWGGRHPGIFDQHFRFGGHAGMPGASWTNQSFRLPGAEAWQSFHGKQETEYAAFALAAELAGMEAACLSASFGGPQILGSNHAALGYDSATRLFEAFGQSLSAQVAGLFDFCQSKNIIRVLRENDWHSFAAVYNGPGQASVYADHINDAYLEARAHLRNEPLHASLCSKRAFDMSGFTRFFAQLNIKHVSAREILFRGRHHAETRHEAYACNGFPPLAQWQNIADAARALDAFRGHVGVPVVLTSIYRSPAYNAAIGGSTQSLHTRFAAIDFEVRHALPASHWATVLRKLRGEGLFAGAIGLHGNALHLDARGGNIDF
jgi:N-acetylmuramidase/Peptidase M15